jgi:UDP-3-O-[3-hydroxymyristoyl] N-acetylglucosamine deacetylase
LIQSSRQQRTIAQPVAVQGFGYWSGRDVRVEFRPAAPSTGVVFVREDLPGTPRIPAAVAHRVEIPRRTALACNKATVEMIEHILAALAGLAIDNCEVWVNQPEMPGCDGSSQPYVDAIDRAGVVLQEAVRDQLVVREITRLGDEDSWIEARPASTPGLSIRYRLDYGSNNAIGRQTLTLAVDPKTFREQLANCRTFMLKEEADWLLAQGLGARASMKDLLVFGDLGPIDNTLRFPDECVRHKILDMVGDFALAGCDIVGQFVAYRSGHRLNAEMVRVLLAEGSRVVGAPSRRKSA